jgi:hypothetical protein
LLALFEDGLHQPLVLGQSDLYAFGAFRGRFFGFLEIPVPPGAHLAMFTRHSAEFILPYHRLKSASVR